MTSYRFNKLGLNKILGRTCKFNVKDSITDKQVTPSRILIDGKQIGFNKVSDLFSIQVDKDGEFQFNVQALAYNDFVETMTYDSLDGETLYMVKNAVNCTFTVVDNDDRTKRITNFTLKLDGNVRDDYVVNSDKSITIEVSTNQDFTLQISNVDGYVDTATIPHNYKSLNGAQIAMNKSGEYDRTVFDCSWTSTGSTVYDFDTHIQIKNGSSDISKGHVYYSQKEYSDSTTRVVLNHDARQSTKPPETITITGINPEYTYYYYLCDYDNQGKITTSDLMLNVVIYNKAITPPFQVPDESPKRYWNVCAIKNGKVYRAEDYLTSTLSASANTTWADSL